MKSQKAQEAGERKPRPVGVSQFGTAAPSSKPRLTRDLHSTICTHASPHGPMSCMSSGAAEKAVPWKIGWMQNGKLWAVNFQSSASSGRGDSL